MIDKDVHCCFFNVFIRFGSTVLYKKRVLTPVNLPKAKSNMNKYTQAGFSGCVGSSNCTHIVMGRCQYNLKNYHIGAKSLQTTWTFNLTCNHWRRILHMTNGGPGRWNDQSMVRLDTFVSEIRDGTVLDDINFELLARDKVGKVKKLHFSGAYLIVDHGYLNWLCTVPPFGVTNKVNEIHWSKWLESMCKDVECTFGILKARWRILKAGVRIHGVNSVDYIWFTCCALHNWSLEIDGMNEIWVRCVHTVVSDWDGKMAGFDWEGVRADIPTALACLSVNLDVHNYNSLGLGPGDDKIGETRLLLTRELEEDDIDITNQISIGEDCVRSVQNLSLAVLWQLLVNHFAILFSQNKIVWPKRILRSRRRIAENAN